ncbi:MAG: Hpt domain-containing protein [Nitrospirae bacterium]|nr:MAG: Hpt domain-containing protein [Nitrospirota bacterium]
MSEKIVVVIDEDLEDIVPGFLENRKADIEEIGRLLEKSDFESIRILGHSMKGSGGGYGFDRITEIGAAIEEAAKRSDAEEIKRQTAELQDYLERVEVRYE